mgnify:CR=1 FL=1
MKKVINIPKVQTPENQYLNDLRSDPNNMSRWLPAITPTDSEKRELRIPKTVIVQVPDDICRSFFMERPGDKERIIQFAKDQIMFPICHSRRVHYEGSTPFLFSPEP